MDTNKSIEVIVSAARRMMRLCDDGDTANFDNDSDEQFGVDIRQSFSALMKDDAISTAALVEILSKREGVERVDVAPHTEKYEIAVCDDHGKYRTDGVHAEVHTGPAVILVVTD